MSSPALIFDFDGVIADTETLHWKVWRERLRPYGIDFGWDEYCAFGKGFKDRELLLKIPAIASDRHLYESLLGPEESARRLEQVSALCSQQPPISSSTVHLLQSLRGFALGLVTSSQQEDVLPLLRAASLDNCFHAFVFGEDVAKHKPDPAPYLLLRERIGLEAGIVFEDSIAGLESAARAGYEVIRVASPEDLPQLVLGRIAQLAASGNPNAASGR